MQFHGFKRLGGFLALAAAGGLALVSAPALVLAQCGADHGDMKQAASLANMDIVDTAVAAGNFKTLVAAVEAAGLVEALKGDGPFTVFAPTDAAFAKLPKGTIENLLKAENRAMLSSILKYHVVSGRVYSDQALTAGSATTLQEGNITVGLTDGGAMVNDAKLVTTDIETTNGVIHVIDKVLMPSDGMSSRRDVREIIGLAIDRGAPLYNDGQPEACAAIYEVAARSLVRLADLDASDDRVLSMALRKAQRTHSASEQAWILRDALDEVYESNDLMRSAMR